MKLSNTKEEEMAKKSTNKKPTMKQTVEVVNMIIREITALKTDIQTLSRIIDSYVEMNNDIPKFNEFIKNKFKIEEKNDVSGDEKSSQAPVEASP